jgi:hypothetical protein
LTGKADGKSRLTGMGLALIILGLAMSAVEAVDAPVILVQRGRLVPERLDVHLGEVVTWTAASGRRVRLELDPHPSGHEVVTRAGEVRAFFRKPGVHWYTVTVENGSGEPLRGTVSVHEGQSKGEQLLICEPESSGRICFGP